MLELHDCSSPADLGPALVRAMAALLDADMHVSGWIGGKHRMHVAASSVPHPREATIDRLASRFHEHPLQGVVAKARRGGHHAARWSDMTTLRQFRQTGLYHDYYRHMGTRHQLGLALHLSHRGVVSLTFNRSRRDFRAEDVAVFGHFGRHVGRSIRRIKAQMEVEDALALRDLAASREAVVIVDDDGLLRFATDRTRQLIRDYFGGAESDKLPDPLRTWLADSPTAGEYLTQPATSKTLYIKYVAEMPAHATSLRLPLLDAEPVTGRLRLLQLHENLAAQSTSKLQELGLTKRQAEILHWMLQGKRNSEIGVILGISERTVDKHREHMFAKLRVETRTAAMALAWEALGNPARSLGLQP